MTPLRTRKKACRDNQRACTRYGRKRRLYDLEYGKPITIGNNCRIAANVTITGGITIGNGCVIGAGSVVTRDIPDNCLAAGNPCRVIREITDRDDIILKKELL